MNEETGVRKRREVEALFLENFSLTLQLANSLSKSISKTGKLFPITEQHLETMSECDFELIELLINRFSKLQDMLGSKVFRAIVNLDFEDASSIRDVLNKMEKKYIIDDISDWMGIREIRNDIIHEYVPRGAKAAETINDVYKLAPELLLIVCNVHKYAQHNLKIDMSSFDVLRLNG